MTSATTLAKGAALAVAQRRDGLHRPSRSDGLWRPFLRPPLADGPTTIAMSAGGSRGGGMASAARVVNLGRPGERHACPLSFS
jgi:hypothetical protein